MERYSRAALAQPEAPVAESAEDGWRFVIDGGEERIHRLGLNWTKRQWKQINNGRAAEPLLYGGLYDVVEDEGLPKQIGSPYPQHGSEAAVFEEVKRDGTVYYRTIAPGMQIVTPLVAVGIHLVYQRDVFRFRQWWAIGIRERQAGVFCNALLNHIHLTPFLRAAYPARAQVAPALVGDNLPERLLRTLEQAVNRSVELGQGVGEFALLINPADQLGIERALSLPIDNPYFPSTVKSRITQLIAYDGWSGTLNDLKYDFSGVKAGEAYLICLDQSPLDFRSYQRSDLHVRSDAQDVFNPEGVPLEMDIGIYSNPLGAAVKVHLPTALQVTLDEDDTVEARAQMMALANENLSRYEAVEELLRDIFISAPQEEEDALEMLKLVGARLAVLKTDIALGEAQNDREDDED